MKPRSVEIGYLSADVAVRYILVFRDFTANYIQFQSVFMCLKDYISSYQQF